MALNMTNESKNTLNMTNESKSAAGTIDDFPVTIDSMNSPIDAPGTAMTNESKNTLTMTNENKN
jgi:hypothetical protein